MGLSEFLQQDKPSKVADQDEFQPIKGFYTAKIEGLSVNEPNQYVESEHYKLVLKVTDTLDGDPAEGRTLRRNYLKAEGRSSKDSKEKKAGNLTDDLFTWSLELPTSSVEAFEQGFEMLKDKVVHVRAYHFAGLDGNKVQMWVAKSEADVLKSSKTVSSPF